MSEPRGFVPAAIDYAEAVAGGRINTCLYARQACERFLEDLDAAQHPGNRWVFDEKRARLAMLFASEMPNIKGPEAGKPIRLMQWQLFAYANIFGFVDRGTGIRRFRNGVIFVPKGNGKTTISAPLAMYITFGENEGGAEGYAAAVTRDQARILFDMAQNMVRRSPKMRQEWGISILKDAIVQEDTASKLVPISSDAKALDGLNLAVGICDEIGSHKTAEVYNALLTAGGKRLQSFILSISTATANTSGIGKTLWNQIVRLLRKSEEDDQIWGTIYTIDDDDDPWAEETWVKANPGWGQSVQPDAIRAIMRQARNNPAQEAAARTRHLNIWIGADEALFSMRAWNACADSSLSIEDFAGRRCHMALDLASKSDLAARVLLFERDGQYFVFCKCYLNEGALLEQRNASYAGWAAEGELIITPGNETDFGWIESDVIEDAKRFEIVDIAYDPWMTTQLAQRLSDQGLPMVEFRATTQNFSEPTKELEAAIRSARITHDGNGPLTWCVGNVVGHYDARSNVYPRKERPENKIDAAIALIMTIARALQGDQRSVYETRGLITLG